MKCQNAKINSPLCSLFGITNFCRDMTYYPQDNLNNLVRWAQFVYEHEFGECIDTDYDLLVSRLSETDWEQNQYPRCNLC